MLIKQDLDTWLKQVDYKFLNSSKYTPTEFALKFVNFVKLVNGTRGESNKTPPLHYAMLDKLVNRQSNFVVNLLFRGSAKTSLFGEYMILYVAIFKELPGLKDVDFIMYISDSMENGAKSLRKNIEHRYENSDFLKQWLPKAVFTDPYLEFTNASGDKTAVRLFGATTSLRGVKAFGKRPSLAILDDLMNEEASKSKATQTIIKDTVYNGVVNALDPTNNLIIFNGTPFNKEDIIVEAVESGAWDASVYPACEQFPCSKENFIGAWEDRFSYDHIKQRYDMAQKTGKLASFYQELMLQITSEDERLVQDTDIRWYSRKLLREHKEFYNFYITTDFATSSKNSADFSVISVWAYNNNGDWFYVDGICKRQTMEKNIDDLFNLVSIYKPQSVGVEVTGQQGAFINWIQKEMMQRNIWFNFASSNNKGNAPGIRPITDKLSRFNLVVPWFKAGKMFFPEESKTREPVTEFLNELRLVTVSGIKGKDDCLDTISMLAVMNAWKPSAVLANDKKDPTWDEEDVSYEPSVISSYIV